MPMAWSLRTAQTTPAAGDAGDVDGKPVKPKPSLPMGFGNNLGRLGIVNFMADVRYKAEVVVAPKVRREFIPNKMPELLSPEFLQVLNKASSLDRFKLSLPNVKTFYDLLDDNDSYDQQSIKDEQQVTETFLPETNGGKGSRMAPEWEQIAQQFDVAIQTEKSKQRKVAPTLAPGRQAQVADNGQEGPLGTGKYQSVRQLMEDLIRLGPTPETYNQILSIVDDEDSAKEALSKFFQGSPAGLYTIYDMMVKAGIAEPIDSEIVETLMELHPDLDKKHDKPGHEAHAGLFLPPLDSGLVSMEKTASRENNYTLYGPEDRRMCPKTRNVVSSHICRFHCLDGLVMDETHVVCGEAIWRKSVMDKFSTEQRGKDGKWTGGYIRNRFLVETGNDGGHPALLKPGQRHAPIHEDAWSMEKRLQEMRKSESKDRKYCETPGDPDVYSFDQHDLAKGPKAPQASGKEKDPISRLASKKTNLDESAAWTLCASSTGGQPGREKKHTKKAIYENGFDDTQVIDSKVCKSCNKKSPSNATECVHCRSRDLKPGFASDTARQTGSYGIENPEFMPHIKASKPSVTHGNGVYVASNGRSAAYGDTARQALWRLANVEDIETGTLEEENEDLSNTRKQVEQVTESEMPSDPARIAPQAPLAPMAGEPDEIDVVQDGVSEFEDQEVPGSQDPKALDEEIERARTEPGVSPNELGERLTPEETLEIGEDMGLGPAVDQDQGIS